MIIKRQKRKQPKQKPHPKKYYGGPLGSLDNFCESSGAESCGISPVFADGGGSF